MRIVLIALAATAAASTADVRSSSAAPKPWCAQIYDRGGDGGRTCGFVSWEQCRATTGLQEGFCLPNPAYRAASVEPGRHGKRSK
jgi:Protein of unknown function (DUF3551)